MLQLLPVSRTIKIILTRQNSFFIAVDVNKSGNAYMAFFFLRLPVGYFPHTSPILLGYLGLVYVLYSLYIPHTVPIHSLYIPHTVPIHFPYTRNTLMIHSPYTPYTLWSPGTGKSIAPKQTFSSIIRQKAAKAAYLFSRMLTGE